MTTLAALVLAGAVVADSQEEFGRIAAAHQLERFDLVVEATFEADAPLPALRATIQRYGGGRELRGFGDLTILETPAWRIAVDAGDRVIVVGQRPTEEALQIAHTAQAPADIMAAWLKRGDTVSGGDVTVEGRRWTLESATPSLPHVDLYVDPETRLIKRLDYETKDSGQPPVRVSIRYTWRDASQLDPRDFDERRFIVQEGNSLHPAHTYADYKIIRSDRSR